MELVHQCIFFRQLRFRNPLIAVSNIKSHCVDKKITYLEGTIISVWTLDNVYGSFASYSTEEKAIKAMEMCREKYLSRMELGGGYDIVNKCYVQPNYWVLPKVFQFPKDEEVQI